MKASTSKKSLIIAIFFFLLLLPAGNASSQVEPIYAGWAVGVRWDDGSGTGSYGTILRSTDSGETWTRQGAGQIADVILQGVFAVDPYTAWVVGDSHDGYATIYHTTDGGTTWERKGSLNSASTDYVPDVSLSKVHAAGDDVWAVGTGGTILHTSDGGNTWTNHTLAGYENTLLQGLYVLDNSTVWVTGYDNENETAVILKTIDTGSTWIRQSGGDAAAAAYLIGISAADANTAWAVGHPYIVLKTTDGGTTWMRHPDFGGLGDTNEVYAVNTSTVWVATDNEIVWSTDGGLNWDHSSDHGLSDDTGFTGISAVNGQKAWSSYAGFEIELGLFGYIAYTTDGGTTWTKIDQLNDVLLPELFTISFATMPIYPDYLIISMIEDVEMLVDDGILNKGQGNAIIVKLEKALDRLDDDR